MAMINYKRRQPSFWIPRQVPLGPVQLDAAQAPRGLLTFLLLRETNTYDLARRNAVINTGAYSGASPFGSAVVDFSLGSGNRYLQTAGAQLPACSIELLVQLGSVSNEPLVSMIESTNAATFDRSLTVNSVAQFYIFDGAQKQVSGSTTLAVGQIVHLVGTSDGSNVKIYVDGKLDGTLAAGAAFQGFVTPDIRMGYCWAPLVSGALKQSISRLALLRFYSRALTDSEIVSLSAEPFAMLRPAERRTGSRLGIAAANTPPIIHSMAAGAHGGRSADIAQAFAIQRAVSQATDLTERPAAATLRPTGIGTVTTTSRQVILGAGAFPVLISETGSRQAITPSGVMLSETAPTVYTDNVGSPSLVPGSSPAATLSPSGIASGEALGSPILSLGAVTLSPSGIASAEALGALTLVPGSVTLSVTGIASGEAVGTPTITIGGVVLNPAGIASGEALGAPTLVPGAVELDPAGIASGEALGSPSLVPVMQATGIASGEAVGGPSLTVGPATLSPTGIASGAAVGSPTLAPGAVTLNVTGIASTLVIGGPLVLPQAATLSPTGIPSSEAVGSPSLIRLVPKFQYHAVFG